MVDCDDVWEVESAWFSVASGMLEPRQVEFNEDFEEGSDIRLRNCEFVVFGLDVMPSFVGSPMSTSL